MPQDRGRSAGGGCAVPQPIGDPGGEAFEADTGAELERLEMNVAVIATMPDH